MPTDYTDFVYLEYLGRLENELLRCGVSIDRLYDLRDAAKEHVERQMEGEGY